MDNMVCSLGIDLQSPADMFHFLCSLCASFYFECAVLSPGQHGWMSDGVH